jgi:hypothetical protein
MRIILIASLVLLHSQNAYVLFATAESSRDAFKATVLGGGKRNAASKTIKSQVPVKKMVEKEQLFEAYNLLHSLAQVCP